MSIQKSSKLDNDDSLMYYSAYSQLIRKQLYNKTYSLGHKPVSYDYPTEFTIDLLLNIIDQENKKLKNLKMHF